MAPEADCAAPPSPAPSTRRFCTLVGINPFLGVTAILIMVIYACLRHHGLLEFLPYVRPLPVIILAIDQFFYAYPTLKPPRAADEECAADCTASLNQKKRARAAVLITVGLLFSAVADMLLEMTNTDQGNFSFPAWFCLFLVHIIYSVAFIQRDSRTGLSTYPICLVAGLVGFFYLRPGVPSLMRFPVGIHILGLVGMLWRAGIPFLSAPPTLQPSKLTHGPIPAPPVDAIFEFGATRAFLGAGLLFISDGILAVNKYRHFILAADAYALGTYWLAQLMISSSAYLLVSKYE